ncbi:MAG: hypothetical protein HC836_30085 [Richelia sp. RM2_1_2]|nr:hypothetical protein [Richelia sp. RM1_1_1]NJO62320.1 hypothetical protein [Richelia sp. RM2_1_2]
MKNVILNSLIVASSILGIAHTVSAESLVNAVIDPNGTVYQVDLDNRSEYYTDSGWRHVKFWLSTKGDVKKHSAIALVLPMILNQNITNLTGDLMAADIPKEQ